MTSGTESSLAARLARRVVMKPQSQEFVDSTTTAGDGTKIVPPANINATELINRVVCSASGPSIASAMGTVLVDTILRPSNIIRMAKKSLTAGQAAQVDSMANTLASKSCRMTTKMSLGMSCADRIVEIRRDLMILTEIGGLATSLLRESMSMNLSAVVE